MTQPFMQLCVMSDREAFGQMVYCGDSVAWPLPDLIGTPGAQFSGLTTDPTGQYVIQAPVPVWQPSGTASWTPTAGTYGQGTDDTAANGQTFLRQTAQGAFSITFNGVRLRDGGFVCQVVRAAPSAGNGGPFYLHFSANRAAGAFGLRLALVPGYPIRLQGSTSTADDASWIDLAVADALGECEAYLDGKARRLSVQVLSLCDPTWAPGLPNSVLTSPSPPPGLVIVSLNGSDAVLSYQTDSLVAGQVRISGSGGQWSCRYAALRFQNTGTATLPPRGRGRAFQTVPYARIVGYDPYGGSGTAQFVQTDVSQGYATLAVNTTALADSTGYSVYTTALSSLIADFPPSWTGPSVFPDVATYDPTNGLVYAAVEKSFDPTTGTVRRSARLTLTNNDGAFSPGVGAALGVRAAQLWMGNDPNSLYPQITGWTGLAAQQGLRWLWNGEGQAEFEVTVHDRLCRGDADQVCVGYQLPYDGQCHFYAVRQLLYRLGVTDDWMPFPWVGRDQATPYYYLPRGTARDPLFQFPADLPVGSALELVRRTSAAYDAASGQIQPMVLSPDAWGNIDYFPLPVGVVSALTTPGLTLDQIGLTPQQVYSATPQFNGDGSPALNEILRSGLVSFAGLRNVRTPVVFEGLDPTSGGTVFGAAYNERLGGGPYSDPSAAGYVGIDVPLYVISRLISSAPVAAISAALASIQLAFPAVGTSLQLHLQPGMEPLTPYAVYDPVTQGTDLPVPYYATHVASEVDYRRPRVRAGTAVGGYLLGQAGG